jgi:hypothetical protein
MKNVRLYQNRALSVGNPAREIWDGERLGIAKALQTLGANQAYPINKLQTESIKH